MEQSKVPVGARRAIRRAVSISCELVTDRCETPMAYLATDLSPFGMWVATADPVRAGEVVVVCLEPRDRWEHGELMVFAEVCRVATSRKRLVEPGIGMGLEFMDLSELERVRLAAWLANRKTPVPRRRRPVRQWSLPEPVDELDGVVAHRPLSVCWR